MRTHKLLGILLVLASALLFACSDDTEPTADATVDSSVDGGEIDAGVDGPLVDTGTDGTPPDPDQAVPDQAVPDQAVPDQMLPDMPVPDMMPPDMPVPDAATTAGKVLYFTGSSTSSLTLNEIKNDGTGKTALTFPPSGHDLDDMTLRGTRTEYAAVTRHRPQLLDHVDSSFQPVYLPGGDLLYYYEDNGTTKGYGFFTISPKGKVTKLAFEPGSSYSSDSYYYYINMNEAGTMMAAAKAYNSSTKASVHLIKLDGTTFTGGKTVCDTQPSTMLYEYPRYYNIIFGKKYVYFSARKAGASGYDYLLYKAPLDCSAKATQVAFPNIGTSAVTDIDYYFTSSDDGSTIAVVVNTGSSSNEEVMVIDDATGTVTNVSGSPSNYAGSGSYRYLMYYSDGYLRLSPTGKYVAYSDWSSGDELYIRDTGATSPAVHITSSTNFASTVDDVRSVEWITDDDVVFWAGDSYSKLDMYHYKVSTKALVNVTQTGGGTTKPFAAGGKVRPYGGWKSKNGKYFYYVEYGASGTSGTLADIKALDTSTFKIIDITKGMYVEYDDDNIEGVINGSRVFFWGEPGGSSGNIEQLYYFDQSTASKAVQVSNFSKPSGSSYWYLDNIMPNTDGSLVAFGAGTSTYSGLDVYVADLTGTTPKVTKMSTIKDTVTDMKLFTPDNKHVIYGVGTTTSSLDLRIQPVGGGTAKVLESTKGYMSPTAAY